jgi:hypothetical protein
VKFHVGQRVRIVKAYNHHEYVGMTGTVVSALEQRTISGGRGLFHRVAVDGIGEIHLATRLPFVAQPCQLEPIRDDDTNTVTTWSACVWQPKALQVRA